MTSYIKIAVYSPYLDTLGGGERYMLTFVEYCLLKGYDVDLWWEKEEIVKQASDRFNLKLDNAKVNPEMYKFMQKKSSLKDAYQYWFHQLKYDLIFWLSDGSIPLLYGKRNWLHFQVPFQLEGKGLPAQYKLSKINNIFCNSQFTKRFIDASFNVKSHVLYPPVDVHQFMTSPAQKENMILSVGRFDQIMNAKRQDVLIDVFKKLCDTGLKSWKLVLAGGLKENTDMFEKLKDSAIGYPIELIPNISWDKLVHLYKQTPIYWHACGFGIDDTKEPTKVEHFGMSIVEAMAAGTVPIVFKSGGVKEIISEEENGFMWDTKEELMQITLSLINAEGKSENVREKAQKRALEFSKERFFMELDKNFN